MAQALELDNITLQQLDIMDLSPEFGKFDYIIAHGIYSWVPPAVRDKLLAICKANLAPNGVAYVSYNTYPGGHLRQIMHRNGEEILDPQEALTVLAEELEQNLIKIAHLALLVA